jgi:Type I restriction enzyme R protein N terminus (HSDR_N)
MVVSAAVTEIIRSLDHLEQYFAIQPANDRDFFTEWQTDLPELAEGDDRHIEQIRTRFRYQRKMGQVAEGLVNAIVVTPLLGLVGFYDPPFQMASERTITVQTIVPIDPKAEDSETKTLKGRVDFLVLQNQFWQAVIESKETSFDIEVGIPQILAYMMAAPKAQNPLFGMVTNGTHFVFIKLDRQTAQYGFSNTFSTLSDMGQLKEVLQILKRIGAIIYPN